jgi:hypothetical protein
MSIKNKSSKKLLKKGGTTISPIFINEELNTTSDELSDLFNKINKELEKFSNGTLKIREFLKKLNDNKKDNTIFDDITKIVNLFTHNKNPTNFQSVIYNLFSKYELSAFENERHFITIDPTIIQIMIFDDNTDNIEDIVYSLKLIIRNTKKLTLRYTTHLFPNESKTDQLNDLTKFNEFNLSLKNPHINSYYNKQVIDFLKKYIKFYNFYRKCYTFNEVNCDKPGAPNSKKLIEYQLKYISILGKARFADPIIQVRTAVVTDYIMSNLLFASPSYAFISGGYKGFKDNKYGVTRSGYEISKRYNRPILTIMCAEGLHDSHEYSDALLIYGEHWGEDSIALSQLTDGAIIIAPFGGWTYIECLTLLANKKIVGIYNDFFNILNYDEDTKNPKNENSNFFKFTPTEQQNIINYNIYYYLILLYLLNKTSDSDIDKKEILITSLRLAVQLLSVLKLLLGDATKKYRSTVVPMEERISKISDNVEVSQQSLIYLKQKFAKYIDNIIKIINKFNDLKTALDYQIYKNLENINKIYSNEVEHSTYQNKIPQKCDGIWIKPLFDLITDIIITPTIITIMEGDNLIESITKKVTINLDKLYENNLFKNKNLHNNIIFVFSDIMYLNIYLNENLNASSFQEGIQNKINALLNHENGRLRKLIQEESSFDFVLSRKIDGTLDEETKTITNEIKLRQDYTFKINDDCNNYTNLITDNSKPIASLDSDDDIRKIIFNTDNMKVQLFNRYAEQNEQAMKQDIKLTKSQSLILLPTDNAKRNQGSSITRIKSVSLKKKII